MEEALAGLRYGKTLLDLDLSGFASSPLVLAPARSLSAGDEPKIVRDALANPIGSRPLAGLVHAGQRVVIVTSDVTRPCPSARLLPSVLEELNRGGVRDEDIVVVFGLGNHRPHTTKEQKQLAGEAVYGRVRCIDSDPTDVKLVGHTRRGTPVAIFRPVLDADVRVCMGALEYHYFAGYSGGYKAIVPGVCTAETIQHNHRMMIEPGAAPGRLGGNPVREDIDEAGAMVGVHFVLNVILDSSKHVVSAVAGHPEVAHRTGCARLDSFGRVVIERPADLVVVSAGGYPKDINLYQAQKALDSARQVVRPGGVILLVAECAEGTGNQTFETWMSDPQGPDAIIARIQREFVLGGHKAAAVAAAMKQAAVYLVSALPQDRARAMGFSPFTSLDDAVQSALKRVGPSATVVIMPEGGSVLPCVEER
jgi:nickel-dependent lactate racemase